MNYADKMTDKEKQIADLLGSACMLLEVIVENKFHRASGDVEIQYDDDNALMGAAHGYIQHARNLNIGAPSAIDDESKEIHDAVIGFVRMEDKFYERSAGIETTLTLQ